MFSSNSNLCGKVFIFGKVSRSVRYPMFSSNPNLSGKLSIFSKGSRSEPWMSIYECQLPWRDKQRLLVKPTPLEGGINSKNDILTTNQKAQGMETGKYVYVYMYIKL